MTLTLDRQITVERIARRRDAVHWEMEWLKCKYDFVYFCNTYWWIQHPSRGRILFNMRTNQIEVADAFDNNLMVLILKARQIGYSTLVAAWAFHKVFFFGETPRNALLLSRNQREARKLLSKVTYGYTRLPQYFLDRGPARTNRSSDSLTFDNDAQIEALPSRSDPARSSTAWLVVLDEMAFFEDPDEAWSSVEPVADVGRLDWPDYQFTDPAGCGGRIIGLSTAKQAQDFFHQAWLGAVAGLNRWFPIFKSWASIPERSKAWYEAQKLELKPWVLAREYPTTPNEAFTKSGNPVFDVDKLALRLAEVEPGSHYDIVRAPTGWTAVSAPDSQLELFELPIKGVPYGIGVDSAAGHMDSDFTVLTVIRLPYLDVHSRLIQPEQVGLLRAKIDPDLTALVANGLGRFYNDAKLVVEVNNHGHTVLSRLVNDHFYPNMYHRRRIVRTDETMVPGFHTTKTTKPMIIDNLRALIREDVMTINSPEVLTELTTYISDNGKMHGFPHDDCVMSLALGSILCLDTPPRVVQAGESSLGTVADAIKNMKMEKFNRQVVKGVFNEMYR